MVGALEAIVKTSKTMDKIKTTSFEDLPSVKKVISRIHQGDGGPTTYQGVELSKYREGLALVQSHYQEYTELVLKCLCERVKVLTADLLTHALTIFYTNGWERTDSPSFGYQALGSGMHLVCGSSRECTCQL